MSDTAKKWLISIGIIILALAIGFLIYWGVSNYEKVKEGFQGTGLYTAADLEKAKMEGYQEGANCLQALEKQIQNFKSQLDTKTKTINELTDKVNALQAEKKELQNTIANKDNEIGNRDELLIEKDQQITSLNEQIISLNNEIIRLNKLLEAYKNYEGQTYTATFYVDDTAVDVKVVDGGTILSQNLIPTKTGNYKYNFKGWSFDKETIIDLTSYTVNENLNLYAVFETGFYSIIEYTKEHVSSVFTISSVEEWKTFAHFVNSGDTTFEGITIRLIEGLNFEGASDIVPVGSMGYLNVAGEQGTYFSGHFDGGFCSIDSLNIMTNAYRFTGLFGNCKNAIIENLIVYNPLGTVDLSLNQSNIGYLCGSITDCTIKGVYGSIGSMKASVIGKTINAFGNVNGNCIIE